MIECVCNALSSEDIEEAISDDNINILLDKIKNKGCSTCLEDIINNFNLVDQK